MRPTPSESNEALWWHPRFPTFLPFGNNAEIARLLTAGCGCSYGGPGHTGWVISSHLPIACRLRRERLLAKLDPRIPATVSAGPSRGRNYVANAYPYRASSHFLYLVGVGIEGAVLWLEDGDATLFVPARPEHDDLWHGPAPSHQQMSEQLDLTILPLTDLAARVRGKRVATVPPFERGDHAALCALLGRSELADEALDGPLLDALVSLRLQHDDGAVAELKRAAMASVQAHRIGLEITRLGMFERDVCAAMEAALARAGCRTAYGSIVTVHGEVLHNHDHSHELLAGDLLLADVGAETDSGYAGDITRTWPVSGRFSTTQREIYEVVLRAQAAAIALVKPGTSYREVHVAASREIVKGLVDLGILRGQVDALVEDGAQALFFPHGIGHLLGLDVHDMEDLGDRAGYAQGRKRSTQFGLSYLRLDRELAPGMLVTIEPGFYQVASLLADPSRVGLSDKALDRNVLAKFADVRGIRIEDDVLVTDKGCEVLTAALPKTADEIEAMVGVAAN